MNERVGEMRKIAVWLLLPIVVLSGCVRSEKTDVVLFCKEFNARSAQTEIAESDAMRRSENEILLTAGEVLIRLRTEEDGAVSTAILTADAKHRQALAGAARTAFSVLADPLGDSVPETFLSAVEQGNPQIVQADTPYFRYLLYGNEEAITVQQIALLQVSLSAPPSLRP